MFFKKRRVGDFTLEGSPQNCKVSSGINTEKTKYNISGCTIIGSAIGPDTGDSINIFTENPIRFKTGDSEYTISDCTIIDSKIADMTEEFSSSSSDVTPESEDSYWKDLAFIKQQIASSADDTQKEYWTTVYERLVEDHQNKFGRTK